MSREEVSERIIAAHGQTTEYFRDVFRSREILYYLAWRDILVRYKQAFFGVAWALIRPLLNMAVFTLIFQKIAHLSSYDVPYPLFVLAGMLPWQLVSSTCSDTSISLINNVNLITKIYFPRTILPLAQVGVQCVDFIINMALLFLLMFAMGVGSVSTLWILPLSTLLVLILCMGVGLWLSALTVEYRDFKFIVTFLVQFGMFASPVGYGTHIISGSWKWVYFLNPMAGIIDSFRLALFGIYEPYMLGSIGMAAMLSLLLLGTGVIYFRKTERSFADRI